MKMVAFSELCNGILISKFDTDGRNSGSIGHLDKTCIILAICRATVSMDTIPFATFCAFVNHTYLMLPAEFRVKMDFNMILLAL